MAKEEIIAMLEEYIRGMQFLRERIDSREAEQQFLDSAFEKAKELLERIPAGDERAVTEVSEILDQPSDS